MNKNSDERMTLCRITEELDYNNKCFTDDIKKESIDKFDFTEDWPTEYYKRSGIEKTWKENLENAWKKYHNLDPIEKFFIYKASSNKEMPSPKKYTNANEFLDKENNGYSYSWYIVDPDSNSKLLQGIYRLLWDKVYLNNCIKDNKYIIGDTMNSVATTINHYICKHKKTISKYPYWGETLEEYCKDKDLLNKDYVKSFVKNNYTLGNFIPVPEACNGPRGKGPTMDYWDLTLLYIYEYYSEEKDVKWVEMILGSIETEKALRYKKWLKSFVNGLNEPDWNEFVKRNYMQPFVCVEVDGKWKNGDECSSIELRDATSFGKPLQLWNEHFCSNTPVLPQEEKDFEQFFDNATKRIKKRGELMKEALIKKLENSPLSES